MKVTPLEYFFAELRMKCTDSSIEKSKVNIISILEGFKSH